LVLDGHKLLEKLGEDPNDLRIVKAIYQKLEELEALMSSYLNTARLEMD
jgi:hypothetical protein